MSAGFVDQGETRPATLYFLLCLPSLVVPPAIVCARQGGITAEVSAALAVTILAFPFCVVPAGLLGLHAVVGPRLFPFPHSTLELSASVLIACIRVCVTVNQSHSQFSFRIWLVWNSHLFGYAAFVLPFLLSSFTTGSTYASILHDYFIFVTFSAF